MGYHRPSTKKTSVGSISQSRGWNEERVASVGLTRLFVKSRERDIKKVCNKNAYHLQRRHKAFALCQEHRAGELRDAIRWFCMEAMNKMERKSQLSLSHSYLPFSLFYSCSFSILLFIYLTSVCLTYCYASLVVCSSWLVPQQM